MKTPLLLLLVMVCVSGCASRGSYGSFAGPLPEQAAINSIAEDAVSILTEMYPPGHTSLRVLPAKTDNGFAPALENGLRVKGFTVAATESADAVTVAYTLDMLEGKAAWYLRLQVADNGNTRITARAYTAQGLPEAGQSRTVVDASRSGLGKAVDAAKAKAGKAYDAARNALTR
jgi:hypothetical protein